MGSKEDQNQEFSKFQDYDELVLWVGFEEWLWIKIKIRFLDLILEELIVLFLEDIFQKKSKALDSTGPRQL